MGWSEIIKAVNSNISVPLNKLITSAKDSLDAAITNVKSGVDTSITNAKSELSTLIKRNGISYPNVIVGKICPGEKIEVTGRGKISTAYFMAGVEAEYQLDSNWLNENFTIINNGPRTLTFEKSIMVRNSLNPSTRDERYYMFYLIQLTD